MIIDKTIGKWDGNLDYIDDIVYQLYVKYAQYLGTNLDFLPPQSTIYSLRLEEPNSFVHGFYDEAKLILRREKINKIRERC